jgi:hypothetical protein
MTANIGWVDAQSNPTYLVGALSELEGTPIKWHSPRDERSSQVFCVSAFGKLRSLPDGRSILNRLLSPLLSDGCTHDVWNFEFEHENPRLLGELGAGTPTSIDVYCTSAKCIVCIESKFFYDARDGFGGCSQIKHNHCYGYYGPQSDRKTGSEKFCRLEAQDGPRTPRLYWTLGKIYFKDTVFTEQKKGDFCPFGGGHFQLMRNFLFANTAAANKHFRVLVIAPKKTQTKVKQQIDSFKSRVLREEHHHKIMLTHYDYLADMLTASSHQASKDLGDFLRPRMDELL